MTKTVCAALFASAAFSALAISSGAAAQTQASAAVDAGSTQVGEVVVTANKRAERALDVALSITAVSGADLQKAQILDLQDLTARVPGLNIIQGGYGNGTTIILRGLNTGTGAATAASVLDEVPISISGPLSLGAAFATDIDPYDLQRIEVLKGPQGTLYGASALGGLIKYVSNPPDPTGYHAGAEAGVLALDHAGGEGVSGKGYVNLPLLNGAAALRVSGFYEYQPGWVDDKQIGQSHTNDFKRYGGRASFLWRPTQDLTINLMSYLQVKRSDSLDNITVNGIANSSDPFAEINGYDFHSYLLNPTKDTAIVNSLKLSYDLHWARLESLTSYETYRHTFSIDSTVYGDIQLFGPGTTLAQLGQYGINKLTQEVRLASEPNSQILGRRFDWQVGAFYTRERAAGLSHYVTTSYPQFKPISTFFGDPEVFFTNLPSSYEETAAYVDGTFHLTSKLDVEGGVRVFHDEQSSDQIEGGALFGFPIGSLGRSSSTETDTTFSTALRYHFTPDRMAYVRVASGYRPGGPQAIIPGGPATCGGTVTTNCLPASFDPDRTVNYEAGVKGLFLDRKLSVDVAGFYVDWSDVQVNVTQVVCPPGSTSQAQCAAYPFTANVGSAKSVGVEGAFVLTPVAGLNLTASGSYADATLSTDGPAGSNSFKGDQLPYNSKYSGTLGFDYEWPVLSNARAFVGGSWSYVGKRFIGYSTRAEQSHLPIPSYDTVSAQLGLRSGGWTLQLYGKNLTDEKGITYYYPGLTRPLPIPASVNLIRPRTVGLRVTADF